MKAVEEEDRVLDNVWHMLLTNEHGNHPKCNATRTPLISTLLFRTPASFDTTDYMDAKWRAREDKARPGGQARPSRSTYERREGEVACEGDMPVGRTECARHR